MKTIRHGGNARDPLLHIEADGVLINVRVGLTDTEGHRVTNVSISPDDKSRGGDGEGRYWYQDGARIIRLHAGEEPPVLDAGRTFEEPSAANLDTQAVNTIVSILRENETWSADELDDIAAVLNAVRPDWHDAAIPQPTLEWRGGAEGYRSAYENDEPSPSSEGHVRVVTCKHCGRVITQEQGRWVDPQATGDDSVWRETCDAHDTSTAEHEPDGGPRPAGRPG